MMLILAGFALILIGFLVLAMSHASEGKETIGSQEGAEREDKGKNVQGGAVVMVGPIPVIVGSDPKAAFLMMLIALAIMLLWVVTGFRLG